MTDTSGGSPPYELHYWDGLQGRGEFIRLALEEAGADYVDISREPESEQGGTSAMLARIKDRHATVIPFAPPFLKVGELIIPQTANALIYLGARHGLAPTDEQGQYWANALQLTIADMVAEVHDTHHPIAMGLYYKDQKPEAQRRSAEFRTDRIPRFTGWLEQVLTNNPDGADWLVGDALTYADLSAFQVVEGLRYAFPKGTETALAKAPRLVALHDRVAALPRIKAYLMSPRRIPFNEDGIFRHYPELDG